MEDQSKHITKVIRQEDPILPEYLDFELLRKEGLDHIGNLSGKIWTDHNAHDPGITILEVLVYALLDLGYRTNLPFEDLIAQQDQTKPDDNFLTPLEVLTVNPVTIIDYRKLLLEVEGVKNAWLEPVEQQLSLYVNQRTNTLSCSQPPSSDPIEPSNSNPAVGSVPTNNNENCSIKEEFTQLYLNGLYNVCIEKDHTIIQNDDDEQALKKEVRTLLSEYRNLCEDFIQINILKPKEFGVCAEVEMQDDAKADKVYIEIIKALKNFIQPEIRYYTLTELLDKGKAIDDIFAGRPYRKESHGFVDTEELESLEMRRKFQLSDLYTVILGVDGVRKVKNVRIGHCPDKEGETQNSSGWVGSTSIPEGYVPIFSLEETCVDLYNGERVLRLDKPKLHRTFSFAKKFLLPNENLDTEVPNGTYRSGLDEFHSIQNDFPVVYGIGEDGLSESATLLRKTQALQLKGYLLFFDQILANYTAQLSNIRSLFSLRPEQQRKSAEKQTYFTKIPSNIPNMDKLLGFHGLNKNKTKGNTLAIPVFNNAEWKMAMEKVQSNSRTELTIGNYCESKEGMVNIALFSSSSLRSIYINQLVDSFYNMTYTIEIPNDSKGYFFVLCPYLPNDMLLVGPKRYASAMEAKQQAKSVAFLLSIRESYSLISDTSDPGTSDLHYFDPSYHPMFYLNLIQGLTEDKTEYVSRRKQFLDHLLARFGEEFTDYTLFQYQNKISKPGLNEATLRDQSNYVNEFAEISRNRARAFNYLQPSWNTDNVSGFEKRVSLLAGINNYDRRNLCNFEVSECYRLQLKDPKGNVFLRSNRSYQTKTELKNAAYKVLKNLRNSKSYRQLEKNLNGFNATTVGRIFSTTPTNENIVVSKYNYHQQLVNFENEVVVVSKRMNIRSEKVALDQKEEFIRTINKQTLKKKNDKDYHLLSLDDKEQYLDTSAWERNIKTLRTWKWHNLDKKSVSDVVFPNDDEAWDHLIQKNRPDKYLSAHDTAIKWKLIIKGNVLFEGSDCYADKNKAVTSWRQAKMLGNSAMNFETKKEGESIWVYLKNEKEKIVAKSNKIDANIIDAETIIDDCTRVFGNRNTKPKYEKEQGKFGFQIKRKDNSLLLTSYSCYDSEKEALKQMVEAFKLGQHKKNYLQSGDEGNPQYNFILKDNQDSFLALSAEDLETASDRDKVLNTTALFFKKNQAPLYVKEEPRRYVWSLLEKEKVILESSSKFTSEARANVNLEENIRKEALKKESELFIPHYYEFKIKAEPARYNFVYGDSTLQNELNPIFIGNDTFENEKNASNAYTDFAQKLPGLSLKSTAKKGSTYDFALFEANQKSPMVVQYRKRQKKATLKSAKDLMGYLTTIYTADGRPQERFISSQIVENQQKRYEWRFYKKNAPLAKSPYSCLDEASADAIKTKICDIIPPISIKECPIKKKVVCPKKDPKKYHYQVCFKDNEGHEFVLISYTGFDSDDEALEAWEREWLDIIEIARDPGQYGKDGKISLDEIYKDPKSKECDDATFIAVIPEEIRSRLEDKGETLVDHFVRLANLYPLYKVDDEDDKKCNAKYKYRVTVADENFLNTDCTLNHKPPFMGSLLWDSVKCYDRYEEAVEAYKHYYTLAGTTNNCRILCEKGCFYVGLVEVLVESSCEFETPALAWDDAFPSIKDDCNNCVPGGVREFIYAAEDDRNYIAVCDQNYWKFKVVSPDYFVVDHACYYNSESQRDEEMKAWINSLKDLNWSKYITKKSLNSKNLKSVMVYLVEATSNNERYNTFSKFCDLILTIRRCLKICPKKQHSETEATQEDWEERFRKAFEQCLDDKLTGEISISELLKASKLDMKDLLHMERYFPVFKIDEGYCFRLYWPVNDKIVSKDGLQPCGCDEEKPNETDTVCDEPYPIISSRCFDCCEEALKAFIEFCELIRNGSYGLECISKSEFGPYSFQIIDKTKELGYHPQQYECLEDVRNAIEITKACVNNTGMHLLEHILLRPKTGADCSDIVSIDPNGNRVTSSCLLPICPDYCCPIPYQPDMDKDDPCADPEADSGIIHYVPGSDPYSFWATLVLPAWAKRFRSPETRQTFEKFLYKEVPALVGLNILWLGPREMCKFEDAYRKWLDWMQDQNPDRQQCPPNDGPPHCALVDCIASLESELPCPSAPEEQGDCNCDCSEVQEYDPCCLPPDTTGTIFWGYCPTETIPVDPTIESHILLSENVTLESETTTAEIASKSKGKKAVPKKKAASPKATAKKVDEKKVLAQIRKRKPQYLANVKAVSDNSKAYVHLLFFIQNPATITGYVQLVNFFIRYSLKKDKNADRSLMLLTNATHHLLDKLVLDQKENMDKETLEKLKTGLQSLKEKGMSLRNLNKNWHSEALEPKANSETLNKLKKIMK